MKWACAIACMQQTCSSTSVGDFSSVRRLSSLHTSVASAVGSARKSVVCQMSVIPQATLKLTRTLSPTSAGFTSKCGPPHITVCLTLFTCASSMRSTVTQLPHSSTKSDHWLIPQTQSQIQAPWCSTRASNWLTQRAWQRKAYMMTPLSMYAILIHQQKQNAAG